MLRKLPMHRHPLFRAFCSVQTCGNRVSVSADLYAQIINFRINEAARLMIVCDECQNPRLDAGSSGWIDRDGASAAQETAIRRMEDGPEC